MSPDCDTGASESMSDDGQVVRESEKGSPYSGLGFYREVLSFYAEASQMVPCTKVLTTKPDDLNSKPGTHTGEKKLLPVGCALTSTRTVHLYT